MYFPKRWTIPVTANWAKYFWVLGKWIILFLGKNVLHFDKHDYEYDVTNLTSTLMLFVQSSFKKLITDLSF